MLKNCNIRFLEIDFLRSGNRTMRNVCFKFSELHAIFNMPYLINMPYLTHSSCKNMEITSDEFLSIFYIVSQFTISSFGVSPVIVAVDIFLNVAYASL